MKKQIRMITYLPKVGFSPPKNPSIIDKKSPLFLWTIDKHKRISSFVRVIVPIKMHGFCISFELFDDTVGIFGIVFSNPGFYARRIKDGHSCLSRIYCLTDRFRNINETMEYELQIIQKVLFEAGDFGSIRDLGKTTEFTKMSGIVKENKEQGIGRD